MQMQLREFASKVREYVNNFQTYWDENSEKDSERFPVELSAEEWVTQFEAWMELHPLFTEDSSDQSPQAET